MYSGSMASNRTRLAASWLALLVSPWLADGALCSNWKTEGECTPKKDSGCSCVWESEDCKTGKVCGGMSITSVSDPPDIYYNLTSGSTVKVKLTLPCQQCRRGFTAAETSLMDKCKAESFTVQFCDCFNIYCSGSSTAIKVAVKATGSNTTKSAETKSVASNTTKPSGSNTTKASESNTTKPVVTASPTVVKGNIKFVVLMNATEAASFVKDTKVVLGVETGIAKQLKLANMSWVKATLSVVTARRLGAAANATANINVDFVITVPATATSAPSASVLEASLQKTDQASKDQWKATLTTEIKKAAPAHANLKVTVSSIAHTPVTTPAPGNKPQLSPSIRAPLPHLAGLVVMVAAALF